MAGFAVDLCVPARVLFLNDIRVTILAGSVSRKVHRASGGLADRVAPIMPIFAEALGYQPGAQAKESHGADHEHGGQSEKVAGFSKRTHISVLTRYCS
jgi:hypothetical protein